ncbi:MAG: hypothetical protein A2887_04635 [Alphaproteobacteria bacterium RIFCSPLOWO2_01_FULL_40_26]|nr:MAG: hypothetical protein A3D15_06140 [Alphaproteobacteria bacterium RIFCSPHIGHO2_02_FULL_40_34]OFW85669.1 MAG: hypothetical protein A2794_00190 [Alphaproteobacteria bacterium RIFCSPHIGHO2_01_FULL_40_8]OFW94154.1 MAG: hypothetical protein A2887_04635 [Alphaproteobacteria bacterium RIFCSPLOWO2_01_FULL_40_26]OFX09298.1 MAG: hypothetical protein A3H30_05420 [Alphaproteobacteria bacterium RIFCSPLOWO2_02_FULL_40_19]OFX10914.1 MAG: hypothetical protein A3G22_01035 [Alphaproteobacteria bacterium RI
MAIFAGRGQLPKILIEDCQKNGRKFLLFLLEGEKYDIDYSAFNPVSLGYGEVEKFLKILHENEVKNLVFIGGVTKPNFSALKVDKRGAILLAKILANKILGDDAVLKTVVNFFEKEGLKILRIDELLDCVVSQKTTLTQTKPSAENRDDIEVGMKAINHFSKFDVGQSVVVAQRQIIAVEALEGTDEMIKRCKNLRQNSVLVKMKKSNQSTKADLPTIGVETIRACFDSGIKGIAVQANHTLVLEKELTIKTADELGLFLTVI